MSDNYETKRTIEEVLDFETGLIINSKDFFSQSENIIVGFRRRLEESIQGYKNPKFVCPCCKQLLKLSGKSTTRGQVSFFAHQHDSDDCEIKTDNKFTKEEIEAIKYGNIRESERHIELKGLIHDSLTAKKSIELGVENVAKEKRVISKIPNLNWRQPDISAEYNGKKIVFELQLSTTFLSVIVERDVFYKMNEIFIIWVFNFSDNQEFVNMGNLMCKDIYYSNKRNAFVFDEKAQKLSIERDELILNCIWFEPFVENGTFFPSKSIKKSEYVSLVDLKFDELNYKPYFIDADRLFEKYQQNLYQQRKHNENIFAEKLKRSLKITEKALSVLEKLKLNESTLRPLLKGDKWGYESDGIIIVEPTYSEVSEFGNNQYARVKKNKKYGFVDKTGELKVACEYIETFEICNHKCILRNSSGWYCLDIPLNNKIEIECESINRLEESILFLEICHKNVTKEYVGVNRGGYNTYKNNIKWLYGLITYDGDILFDECQGFKHIENRVLIVNVNHEIRLYTNDKSEIFPYFFNAIKGQYNNNLIIKKDNKFGYINIDGEVLIPFIYNSIENFKDGIAIAKRNDKFGAINEKGDIIIPFKYYSIGEFKFGIAKVNIDGFKGMYGYIDHSGKIVIPIEYDYTEIQDVNNKIIKAKKNNKWGCLDITGKIIVPFDYDLIGDFTNGIANARKDGYAGQIDETGIEKTEDIEEVTGNLFKGKKFQKWGLENINGEIIIPFKYDYLGKSVNGITIAKKNGLFGAIDNYDNTIIPFDFLEIDDFHEGIAKAETKVIFDEIEVDVWGVIDEKGKTIIPFEYLEISDFINEVAILHKIINVYSDNNLRGYVCQTKFGVVNSHGVEIIPFIYDIIEDFIDGKTWVLDDNKWGYFDDKGNQLLKCEFESYSNFSNGKAEVVRNWISGFIDENGIDLIENAIEIKEGILKGTKFSKWGIENINKEILVSFIYDEIEDINEERYIAKLNGKWGAFNEQFNPVIQFVFEEIDRFVNGKTKAKLSNKWGVIDTFGNTIIPFDFERIDNFQNEIAAAKNDSKWGAIDINGNIIIPFVYDETFQFINGKAKVKKNNILGLIDITGNPIIEQHSKINDNLIIGQKFFKQGIQDGNGNVLIPFEYDKIIDSQNNSFIVLKDNSYSFMDYNGNNINSQRFDYIETYKNNYAIVKKDGKYGMIDNIYTTIIDLQYDELIFLGDNVIKIRKNEYWGIINNDNKILIPIKFKQIEKYKNGIANVKKFGVWEKTDSTGLIETKNKIELSSNVFMGTKFGKYGLENNEGKVLIPFKYDNISPYANGKAICYIYDKFKIEFNLTFKTMPYHCLANGSSKFGIFFEIPSLEKQPYHLDYDSDLDRQMIKVKGLLHINEIIKNNMKIEDFKVGKFYDLYIQFADEKKQRLSFSLNTLSQAKESKEDNNKVIENEQN